MKPLTKKFRGLFNKYHRNMPFFEIVLKDLNYLTLWVSYLFKNKLKNNSILVYPHYPSRGSTIYKVGKLLGYNITNKPESNTKFAVYWEYLTFREEYQLLEKISDKKQVINLFNRNISKLYIDKVHKKVFGYSTIVDPLIYHGEIVKKNDINAKHDGEILQAPIKSAEEGYIYQILIDNTFSEDLVTDIRVPVVGSVLKFVYIKYRHISERFKNTTVNTKIEPTDNVLNSDEIKLLNDFCNELKLEYGELDVLRNKKDKKIYVVDVNNTPQGPPANISKKDATFALNEIADTLQKYTETDNLSSI